MQVDTTIKKQSFPFPAPESNLIPGTRVKAPTFLTSDQAANYLGVNPRLMENWRWRKVGPTFAKVGHRIRYNLNDLKSFIKTAPVDKVEMREARR